MKHGRVTATIYSDYTVTFNGNGGTNQGTNGLIAKYDGIWNNGSSHVTNSTTWQDIGKMSYNGTIYNGTWGDNYLQFNGSNTWVNFGVMNSNYQTLEATFSIDSNKTDRHTIISNQEGGGGAIYVETNHLIQGEFYIANVGWKTAVSNVTAEVGKIYHVAVTFDGTNIKLYVNGTQNGIQTLTSSGTIGIPSSSTVMALGTNPGGSAIGGSLLNGKIYNAAIYNRALTATEIANDAGKLVTYGRKYGTLPTPVRAGYTFNGWYTNPTDGTKIESSTKVTETSNHTLYAQWTQQYSQIQYIQSTGTQYIDTGYYITKNTGIDVDYQFTDLTLQQRVFGNSGNAVYQYYINGASAWAYAYQNTSGNWVHTAVAADTNRHNLKFNVTSGKILIDNGSKYNANISGTLTNTGNNSLFIMATNDGYANCYGKEKIFGFKIYENGILVRNYIPSIRKTDNKPGLYDSINDRFYTNAGTGEFVTP